MSQEPSSSVAVASGELLLPLARMADLFNAPTIAPLSSSPAEVLGVSGVEYLLNILNMDKLRQRARTLVLLLPVKEATAVQAQAATEALHRHAQWRIERDRRELRNTYRYGFRVAGIAVLVLAVCLAVSSLFTSAATEWMRPLTRHTFEYGFEIMGWVMMWHPIETLFFTPLAIRYRIAALRTLAAVQVVIR